MAEYISQNVDLPGEEGEKRYEVVMLASGVDGTIVDAINPLPVTLGSENITITGSVNIGSTVEVISSPEEPVHTHISEVGTSGILDIPNLPISIQDAAGNINSSTHPVYTSGTVEINPSSANSDAFGRLRVSEPYTLADYTHVYGEESELLTLTNGSGLATLRTNEASVRLSVGVGNGDYVIHQSRMHHHYMPGKSQMALMSFVFGSARLNTVKRLGLFGEEDGIYFQQAGDGTLQFVKRTSISGSMVDETPINQNSWNVDPCNGTGPSGFNLNISKSQLLFCDYQWLGVGRIRIGFVHDGEFILAHEFLHSNNISTVYWRNPHLPVRCEIRNTGIAVGTAYMDQICATVVSEGGYAETAVNFSYYAENIELLKGAPATAKCIMAIRLKDTYNSLPNRSLVRLADMNILSESAPIVFELWRLPGDSNITAGSWVSANNNSIVEYNISATGFNTTGGELFTSGFVAANNPSGKQSSGSAGISDPAKAKRAYIAQNINSTESNIFALVARNLSSTTDTVVHTSLQWRETR